MDNTIEFNAPWSASLRRSSTAAGIALSTLGRYRALATDPSRAVILHYPKRRIVVTPGDPQRFIVRVRTLLKHAQG